MLEVLGWIVVGVELAVVLAGIAALLYEAWRWL